MAIALSRTERVVTFGAFLLLAGALVGGAYLVSDSTPKRVAVKDVGDEPSMMLQAAALRAPVEAAPQTNPRLAAVATETITTPTAPITPAPAVEMVAVPAETPKLPKFVFASESPQEAVSDDWAWQGWQHTSRPAEAIKPTPAIAIAMQAPKVEPEVAAQVAPYQINLAASHVIHMYTGEEADGPCWYELKLDRPQADALRAAVARISQVDQAEVDEFDELTVSAPAAPIALQWWRPIDLTDVDLITVIKSERPQWWIAISQRTGRVFLYADRPVLFAAS